jgi:hypothetical protein
MRASPLTNYNSLFFERIEKHLKKESIFSKAINATINILFYILVTAVIFVREGKRKEKFISAQRAPEGQFQATYSKLA